jgi:Flp pilus assembly protein TadG
MKIAVFKRLRDDCASEIAEAALVLPIALMVLLGIYWFGRAFNVYATINDAAREGARVALAQSCGTCGNAGQTAATVAGVVTQTMQASSVDPGQITAYSTAVPGVCGGSCKASNNINVCTNVQLSTPPAGGGAPACGVAVSFQYPYQFWLPFTSINNQRITLTADVQMAGEY